MSDKEIVPIRYVRLARWTLNNIALSNDNRPGSRKKQDEIREMVGSTCQERRGFINKGVLFSMKKFQ